MPARNSLAYRVMWVIIGNVFLSLGQSIHRLSGFGISPFVCMNLGVSSHLPISMGTLSMLVNICLFIPVFMYDKRVLGIGAVVGPCTLVMGFFTGPLVDAFKKMAVKYIF